MSDQIQYNYYNTLATKTGDHTFIFRGKRNSPNLVLPNSDSYVSAKLTILPDEGLIEIEHEPITNYNKRAIVRFPLKLDIDIARALGESQEINLNALISKSIRFDVDDSGDVIRLNPIDNSSTEGFCSKKGKKALKKELSAEIDKKIKEHLNKIPHGCGECSGGNNNNNNNNITNKKAPRPMPSRFVSANFVQESFKEGVDADVTDDNACVASVTNGEKDEMGYVFSTNPGTEKSVYHTAVMGVIWFVITFFLGRELVAFLYRKLVTYNGLTPASVDRIEIGFFVVLIFIDLMLWFVPSKNATTVREIAYWFTIAMFSLLYFIYDARRSMPMGVTLSNRDLWLNPFIELDGWKPIDLLPNVKRALRGESLKAY